MALKAVVFDLDGLMFNTEDLYQIVGDQVLQRRGKRFTRDLQQQMIGLQSHVALKIMIEYHNLDDSVDDLLQETREGFKEILDDQLALMPGVESLLDHIEDRNIPKAIGTSSRRAYVERVLNQFDMLNRFEFHLTAEDIENGKPEPDIYLTAARRFNIHPSEMIVFEDSYIGFTAAKNSGAMAIAVPSGPTKGQVFGGATLVLETLADQELYDFLQTL